jgi:hypothetical protein
MAADTKTLCPPPQTTLLRPPAAAVRWATRSRHARGAAEVHPFSALRAAPARGASAKAVAEAVACGLPWAAACPLHPGDHLPPQTSIPTTPLSNYPLRSQEMFASHTGVPAGRAALPHASRHIQRPLSPPRARSLPLLPCSICTAFVQGSHSVRHGGLPAAWRRTHTRDSLCHAPHLLGAPPTRQAPQTGAPACGLCARSEPDARRQESACAAAAPHACRALRQGRRVPPSVRSLFVGGLAARHSTLPLLRTAPRAAGGGGGHPPPPPPRTLAPAPPSRV